MAKTIQSATILLVSKDPSVIETTQTTLAKEDFLHLMDQEVTSNNLYQVIKETHPDIILLDLGFQPHPFSLLDEITSSYPTSAVVAVLSKEGMANVERVVLSGARAFIQYPFQPGKLVITLKRVMELLGRNQVPAPSVLSQPTEMEELDNLDGSAKTFTVFSPKGGVGTTTLATNLAIALHKNTKEDVLLIDGKHLFGHVALFLNLLTGNSITDLIVHAGMLDQQLINQVVIQHASGIHVLPSPNSITAAQGIRPENLFKVVQSLQQIFPYIVIDGGNTLNENAVTYMDLSDRILLVLNPDLASLRDVRQFMEISVTLSYPQAKSLLILNLNGRKADVKKDEIEDILKMKVFGMLPADENLALSCLNEGVPIVLKKSRHPLSKAFDDIAKALLKNLQS